MPIEVVARDRLVPIIDAFLKPFKEDPQVTVRESKDKIPRAAVKHLALVTGKKPDTVYRALRRIREENTSGFVMFETADWIVAVGMGRPDLFQVNLEVIVQESDRYNAHHGLVPCSRVGFALEELCKKLGPKETARMLGVSRTTIYDWREHRSVQMRKEYAVHILRSLREVRNGNGSTE